MKAEYKILWFEDQFEHVQGDVERLKDIIKEHGFDPEIIHKESINEEEIEQLSARLSNYNPFDLIIFDYDLGEGSEDGLSIASHLRSRIFTDMIFYSGISTQDLRRKLFEEEVDGVFIVHRNTFFDDVEPIIEDHIKKISDINNMRGVVMSEFSKIELEARNLLLSSFSELSSDKLEEFFEEMKKKLALKLNYKIDKINGVGSIEELVGSFNLVDFEFIRGLIVKHAGQDIKDIFKNDSLIHNLQKERNQLAHCTSNLTADGRMIVIASRDKFIEYDFSKFTAMRKEFSKARLFFAGIK